MLTYQITKHKSKEEILLDSLVGVEFEFYSNKSPEDTAKELGILLKKKVRLEDKAHSDFKPTDKEFKLEPDMSGGKGLMELVTGALPYENTRLMIINVLNWIDIHGYTTDKSSIHLNVSFDPKKTDKPGLVSKMDALKFVLDFNEREIYKMFPERDDSVYAKSIKWIMPKIDSNYFNGQHINSHSFNFAKEKYYGVNFEKLPAGYLEFRYIGGKDYHKKTSNILYLLDRFILQLWHSANESGKYSDLNLIELKRILNKNQKYVDVLKDYKNLEKHYKDLKILVDLKDNDKVINLYWDKIKHSVIKLLSHGSLEKGIINYDSDLGRVQVKGGELGSCFDLSNYDFIDCVLSGTLEFCDFFRCELESTNIKRCNLYQGTQARDSKVESCYTNQTCELTNCYVFQWDSIFKGRMIGGIFRHGKISQSAEFEKTEIINSKKIN